MNSYPAGATVLLGPETFKVGGVATDPDTVTLDLTLADGTTVTYTYAAAQLTRNSVGVYQRAYGPVTQLGVTTYKWTGTGAAAGVFEGQFVVTDLLPAVAGVRASMATLVSRVRLLINDPASGTQQFSDAQLQQWLDENREDVRYLELTPEWQTSGTATQWFSFYDGVYGGHWESDVAFVSRAWSPVFPDTSDYLTGKWTWNTSQFPPIFISGRTYDVYSAAADALEAWAASVALDFDVSTGRNNLSLSRSQKHAQLLKIADQYRARGRTTSIPLIRSDT